MENFDLENFPTSKSAKKMLSHVSDGFYDKSYISKWIFQVMGIEYDKALEIANNLPEQFFPETATWGLMYHEIKWGLPVRTNLSYEERRKLIYQKRDCRVPMTPYQIEKYIKNTTEMDIFVADIHDAGPYNFKPHNPNMFKVFFNDIATENIKEVLKKINYLKQSHTLCIANNRCSLIMNNHNVEKIVLKRIQIKLRCEEKEHMDIKRISICVSESIVEKFGNAEIITRRNLLYFNGLVKLDGSKMLNSIDKKEVL